MADEEESSGEGAPKKKSNMMLFIILGLVLILGGGGGFFAYNKFLAPPLEEDEKPQEKVVEPEAVGEMVTFGEFVVNLSDPKGKRYLKCKISVELEVPEEGDPAEAVTRVKKIEPKLRDIVIMLLTSLAFEEVMTPEGKIRIRDELLARFNQAARPDKIIHLYFSDFVVQ